MPKRATVPGCRILLTFCRVLEPGERCDRAAAAARTNEIRAMKQMMSER
jgi:hypothetical protein